MEILVTGGKGFLGVNLCKKLRKLGHYVYSMDMITSEEKYYIQHDIIEKLPRIKVDVIFNLASTPSPAKYLKDPIHTVKTNIIGVMNVLDLAVHNDAKILQASTCEVYEDFDILDQRACYRHGKKMAESLFYDYYRYYNIIMNVARLGNVYGPGMKLDDGRVIPEFIRRALNNEDIIIMGGEQKRSFCYVDDMIDALILLMESHYILKPINIRSMEELSISEIAEMIIIETNSKSKKDLF